MELLHRLVTEAPNQQDFRQSKPTLLVSWWSTFYAFTIILFRVCGRYVRAEKIFIEDGLMLIAILPLFLRMGSVQVVLLFGTNNTVTAGLTAKEIRQKEYGSQLVLVSRIMYATYLWIVKYSVSMFLRTLTESVSQRSHQRMLRYLHIFLAVTLMATIASGLGACRPFSHYWQVVPDPGPQCRQGYANLFTMGILDIITNLTLVLFPIPMILKAQLTRKRQIGIIIRLGLPLISVILTFYQLPSVVSRQGEQQFRSLIASIDILVVTFTSNAVVLGSLLQDRGYKKSKYKPGKEEYRSSAKGPSGTRILTSRWTSDEDLILPSHAEDADGNSEPIILEELRPLPVPLKAKMQEIRVAQTWEIQVDEISPKE